jgi:hypothetical protein
MAPQWLGIDKLSRLVDLFMGDVEVEHIGLKTFIDIATSILDENEEWTDKYISAYCYALFGDLAVLAMPSRLSQVRRD